jgi:hypothetical protein
MVNRISVILLAPSVHFIQEHLETQLADVPFDQLLEAQQTMGLKKFKKMRDGVFIDRDEDDEEKGNSKSSKKGSKDPEPEKGKKGSGGDSGRGTTSTVMDSLRRHAAAKKEKELLKREKRKAEIKKRPHNNA